MIIDNYKSLEEKKFFFQSQTIDKKTDFDAFYEEMRKEETSIFRGVPEARYKLFTTAQREWLKNEYCKQGISFSEFIQSLLNEIQTNSILSDYYKSLNINENDLLYISLLQHYGAPTPMLDFTHDFNVSLCYAFYRVNTCASFDIDNYVSLYIIDRQQCGEKLVDIISLLKDGLQKEIKLRNELLEQDPYMPVDDSHLRDVKKYTSWLGCNDEGLSKIQCSFLDNPLFVKEPLIMDETHEVLYWSNIYIIAQKGCFIFYTNEKEPLEQYFGFINNQLPKIKCVNIHKSLADYIQDKYLKRLGMSELYPQMEDMCNNAYMTFKKKLG